MITYRVSTPNYWALIRAENEDQVKAYYEKYFAYPVIGVRKATAEDIRKFADLGGSIKSVAM